MDRYIDLLIAICEQAYKDLVTAYYKKDEKTITECEKFFTSSSSIFSYLSVDGSIIIEKARKEGLYDK